MYDSRLYLSARDKLFEDLGIIRDLEDKIEYWKYEGLDEVNRAANLVKEQMKKNGII